MNKATELYQDISEDPRIEEFHRRFEAFLNYKPECRIIAFPVPKVEIKLNKGSKRNVEFNNFQFGEETSTYNVLYNNKPTNFKISPCPKIEDWAIYQDTKIVKTFDSLDAAKKYVRRLI